MQEVKTNQKHERRILVTGASGYIGGRLIPELLLSNPLIRVMVRDKQKISNRPWINQVEVSIANAKDYATTEAALQGVHTAFYLLHSMTMGSDFENLEAINAKNFAKAAEVAGVKQIVYLGGIANDRRVSKHMRSRINTGRILGEGSVPTLQIRAGIIIGTGAASFEMLRHLIDLLPFMTTPKWVRNRTQPIAISDVLFYLSKAGTLEKPVKGIFDIAGPDILSYAKLFKTFAKVAGLRRRSIIPLPFPSPRLSSWFIGAFTPLPTALARPLVGSLIGEVVADPKKSLNGIIDPPPGGLLHLQTAIGLALSKTSASDVQSQLLGRDARFTPWALAPGDPIWAGDKTSREGIAK